MINRSKVEANENLSFVDISSRGQQGGNVSVHQIIKNQDINKGIMGQIQREIGIVIPLQCRTVLTV